MFSIRTYLYWIDQHNLINSDEGRVIMDEIPEKFLNYLKDKVSNPCSKTKRVLQLLIRENLTFIATIACVTSNMLCLPSTVSPLERKLAS